MSVRYSSMYGFGYKIPKEMIKEHPDIYDSDYFYILDGYTDNSDGFFGIILAENDNDCDAQPVHEISAFNVDEYHKVSKMFEEYKNIFQTHPYSAQHYLITQIT